MIIVLLKVLGLFLFADLDLWLREPLFLLKLLRYKSATVSLSLVDALNCWVWFADLCLQTTGVKSLLSFVTST